MVTNYSFVFCYFALVRNLIKYRNCVIFPSSTRTKITTIRKTITINLNNIYFNIIKKIIRFKLIREIITISFVFFSSNAKKKTKIELTNKTIIQQINCS